MDFVCVAGPRWWRRTAGRPAGSEYGCSRRSFIPRPFNERAGQCSPAIFMHLYRMITQPSARADGGDLSSGLLHHHHHHRRLGGGGGAVGAAEAGLAAPTTLGHIVRLGRLVWAASSRLNCDLPAARQRRRAARLADSSQNQAVSRAGCSSSPMAMHHNDKPLVQIRADRDGRPRPICGRRKR